MVRMTTWSRETRTARALVCGVVTVALATAAHVAGGGVAPGASAAVGLVLTVSLVSGFSLARPSSRARIVSFVLAVQMALHLVLSALSSPMSGTTASVGSSMAGMGHTAGSGMVSRLPDGWFTMVLHHAVDGVGTSAGVLMLGAHVLAAVLVGLWLAGGERLLWSLLALATAPLAAAALRLRVLLVSAGRAVDPNVTASLVALLRWDEPSWRPTSRYAVNATARRGPPRAALRVLA